MSNLMRCHSVGLTRWHTTQYRRSDHSLFEIPHMRLKSVLLVAATLLGLSGCEKETVYRPGKRTNQSVTNSIGMQFQHIPAGTFLMGSKDVSNESPVRSVRLTKDFFLGTTEVTQSQWIKVMRTSPWSEKENVTHGDNYPATFVSWTDAVQFCRKLSQLDADASYRLPTEAEWEYACRAGSGGKYTSGNSSRKLGDLAWHRDNAFDAGYKSPMQVATKSSNNWGLHDMHGNVNEWCHDRFKPYESSDTVDPSNDEAVAPDPDRKVLNQLRAFRGGAWYFNSKNCRSAYRDGENATARKDHLGFRVVRIPKAET